MDEGAGWRERRMPEGFAPPALGPERMKRLDRQCFGDKSADDEGADAMEDEMVDCDQSEDESGEAHVPTEPLPIYA